MMPSTGNFEHDEVGEVCYEFERSRMFPDEEDDSTWTLEVFFEFPDPRPDVMPGDDWLRCSFDGTFDEKPPVNERDLRSYFDKVAPRLW